jgi:uncharacterized membrane protein
LSHLHYLPLPLSFYSLLAAIYLALVALIQIGILRYAYTRIGIGPGAVLLLLLASLLGSYFNIPVAHLPGRQVFAHRYIGYFGMRYAVPVVVDWPGTIIAVNVGGALVPGIVSLYLLIKSELWVLSIIATACVAAICNTVAHPVQGLGIALPVFVPALTAGIVAMVLSRHHAAALAYISGSMGTLIGADLLNLGAIRAMGAPVASIGGAGTFDGIFLAGILAVLIAGLSGGREPASRTAAR